MPVQARPERGKPEEPAVFKGRPVRPRPASAELTESGRLCYLGRLQGSDRHAKERRGRDPGPSPGPGPGPRPGPGPGPGAVLGADAWMWILLWGHQVVPT